MTAAESCTGCRTSWRTISESGWHACIEAHRDLPKGLNPYAAELKAQTTALKSTVAHLDRETHASLIRRVNLMERGERLASRRSSWRPRVWGVIESPRDAEGRIEIWCTGCRRTFRLDCLDLARLLAIDIAPPTNVCGCLHRLVDGEAPEPQRRRQPIHNVEQLWFGRPDLAREAS